MNPTVVMTAMGRKGWSEPSKAAGMIARIPIGRFAGDSYNAHTKCLICDKCLSIAIRSILNDRIPTYQVRIFYASYGIQNFVTSRIFDIFVLWVHVTVV